MNFRLAQALVEDAPSFELVLWQIQDFPHLLGRRLLRKKRGELLRHVPRRSRPGVCVFGDERLDDVRRLPAKS